MNELILIIEDNEAIVKLLQRGLVYEGYKVDVALDGEAGLKMAKEHHPDLVVLDLMLPGIDGIEVCKELRSDSSSLPILMLPPRMPSRTGCSGWTPGRMITWLNPSNWMNYWLAYAPSCAGRSLIVPLH